MTGILVSGTHAHAYVQSYRDLTDIKGSRYLKAKNKDRTVDFPQIVMNIRDKLGYVNTNIGELSAFISYALSWPDNLLLLIDTYDTLNSGMKNFICVAIAIQELGYKPIGIRLDSGDLAYLSKTIRTKLEDLAARQDVQW